jgi:zinc transport system substrate-binding protein
MPQLSVGRALGALLLMALALASPAAAEERPRAVAVSYALAYFAERLGGAAIDVEFPVPEGADPEFWRPGIAEIGAIQSAELILLNGAGFARWTARASLPRARTVVTARAIEDRFIATEAITHSHGDGGAHTHEGTAAYTWLDQQNALAQARAVAEALKARGLVPAQDVDAAFALLATELDALHAAALALAPLAEGVPVISTHPRYQYLARAYGLTLHALEWEAGAAPGPAELDALRALADRTGARVLIWEAEPPAGARDAVRALGLADTVFPTLASRPAAGYAQTFERAVADLAAALAVAGAGE